MKSDAEALLEVQPVQVSSSRQRLFMRYFTAILIDLTVLNLFAEYWDRVVIESFTISLMAAVLLQVLLKLTVAIEHRVAGYFNAKGTVFAKFLRYTSAWAILFSSKFAILGAINLAFGGQLHFVGKAHGIVPLLAVIIAMLVTEELVVRLYRRLA